MMDLPFDLLESIVPDVSMPFVRAGFSEKRDDGDGPLVKSDCSSIILAETRKIAFRQLESVFLIIPMQTQRYA